MNLQLDDEGKRIVTDMLRSGVQHGLTPDKQAWTAWSDAGGMPRGTNPLWHRERLDIVVDEMRAYDAEVQSVSH